MNSAGGVSQELADTLVAGTGGVLRPAPEDARYRVELTEAPVMCTTEEESRQFGVGPWLKRPIPA